MMSPRERLPRIRRIVLWVAALAHCFVYLQIVFDWFRFDNVGEDFVVIGILLAQLTTCAIVVATSESASVTRFIIPCLSAVACWFGICRIMYWVPTDSVSLWWAVAIAFQTAGSIAGVRIADTLGHAHRNGKRVQAPPLRFPIRALIFLTTVSAVGFAVVGYGTRAAWWSAESLNFEEATVMGCVGTALALSGIFGYVAIAPARWGLIATKFIAFPVLIVLLAVAVDWAAVKVGINNASELERTAKFLLWHFAGVSAGLAILEYLPLLLSRRVT